MSTPHYSHHHAVLSDDGLDRYELRRVWDLEGPLCRWIIVVNLYALRATNPRHLGGHPAPVGARNDHHIQTMATVSTSVICAWGTHPLAACRAASVEALLHRAAPHLLLRCVGRTGNGAPRRPLYVPATATPIPLRAVTE